ncbi:hypothetical protein [Pseudoduganella buxea]|uniref:Uncharacterized protein n=1 Tax=Pseudoduganella buxea TaxID=1949069 RepID=A0A6I3T3M9_9BURK|nr:hypothetical protein [Pseudoduganella buxea]MTV55545.1 hypothetical protein [Pseudoduganella buxea]GGC22094.1 hypothetical protein GCM10011572_49440 [Pseudoduganella buxea]
MARRFNIADFKAISQMPATGEAEWLIAAEDSVAFLKESAQSEEVVIYASGPAAFVHAVLAPLKQVTPANHEDLMHAFVQTDESWTIQKSYGGGESHRVYLEAPLQSRSSLAGGEKLIFRRSFDGVHQGDSAIELSQKLIHALRLHFVPERNAYCRLDGRGDIEDVVRVIRTEPGQGRESLVAVTILAKELCTYMTLADMALVYFFDFTRFKSGSFNGWGEHSRIDRNAPDLFYHGGSINNASYVNGRMIVRSAILLQQLIDEWEEESNPAKNKEYASFKIFDRKNKVEIETSCAPEFLSNYFQKSRLPWEISPAFFRPDVLHRFKADPEKYSLDDRSIGCRNAWHLKGYDINDVGQVHAYIGDLARLPIEEQRYWQSFNEWPKGTISKRAYENDILGEFSCEYDPLDLLKYKIGRLNAVPPEWWQPRSQSHMDAARYPATDSTLEWANEIMAFDQVLVEGFQLKPLRKILEAKGKKAETSWASLRVSAEILVASGQTTDEAKAILWPLSRVHALRNILKAHSSVEEKDKEVRQARAAHGTLRAHFKDLAGKCDKSFDAILLALGAGDLNP